jgi:malonate transporter
VFEIIKNDIFPIFSALVLGFALGKYQIISRTEAATLNKIGFMIFQPALIFTLIQNTDISGILLPALALYALAQGLLFLITLIISLKLLKLEFLEAWLVSMCVVFVNTLMYIWPISQLMYGTGGNLPINAVVLWDATITFAFFIISTDLIANSRTSFSVTTTGKRLIQNPVLIAILLAVCSKLVHFDIDVSIIKALGFIGPAAPPMMLLALGIILSQSPLIPNIQIATITGIKLIGLPVILLILITIFVTDPYWEKLLLLNSAGPSGAMAFALAMLHRAKTDIIAPVIIWTSLLSLPLLAILS